MQVDEIARKDELSSSSFSSSPERSTTTRLSFIEHRVSKLDTLAGVAIKYGVEVSDIKRTNSLVTDLQMFALKTLKIPLPGRHPPSPITLKGISSKGEQELERQPQADFLKSCQSLPERAPQRKISHAMSSLLGYYGLSTPENNAKNEGTEMTVYLSQISPNLEKRFENSQNNSSNKSESEKSASERPVRRRQKADDDLDTEKGFESIQKYGNQLEFESLAINGVIKSSSASNLLESERSTSAWLASKRSTKSDSPSKPFFDSLPKPIAFRKSKAAID